MPPNNPMTIWGNEKTMNLNTLVLTNIQSSPYFKVNLFELKTYHEVIDEIYYKVGHLEPWEKGSRKTAGQTGMCGGVRGVGAGGIVSSAYCLLFKLFTLKLTKKQVIGLINHRDSPYIRGLGFMYIRYTQPPADLWPWFEDYLDDEEEIDVKAGGGHVMTIGEMLRQWLVKLEWYSTLFPRIPVPIEKDIAAKLKTRPVVYHEPELELEHIPDNEVSFGEASRRGGGFQDNSRGESYRKDSYRDDNRWKDSQRRETDRGNGCRSGDNYHGRDSRGDGYRSGVGRGDSHRDSRGGSYYGGDSRDIRRGDGRADSYRDGDSRGDGYRGRDSRSGHGENSRGGDYHRGRDSSPVSQKSPSRQRHQRSSPSYQRSSTAQRSRSSPRPDYMNSFERDLARERERQQQEQDQGKSRSRSPRERKEKHSRSQDKKEKSGNKNGVKDRSHESSSHKRSHKDKKEKRREKERYEEKAHKHKSREKERK